MTVVDKIQYILTVLIPSVKAQGIWPDGVGPDTWQKAVQDVINTLLMIVVVAAVIFIMFAGMQYITSQGDATKAKTAMSSITNAVIGIIVAFAAYVLVTLVLDRIGGAGIVDNINEAQ